MNVYNNPTTSGTGITQFPHRSQPFLTLTIRERYLKSSVNNGECNTIELTMDNRGRTNAKPHTFHNISKRKSTFSHEVWNLCLSSFLARDWSLSRHQFLRFWTDCYICHLIGLPFQPITNVLLSSVAPQKVTNMADKQSSDKRKLFSFVYFVGKREQMICCGVTISL